MSAALRFTPLLAIGLVLALRAAGALVLDDSYFYILPIDADLNSRPSALYSSMSIEVTGSSTLTIREWLKSQSFEFNHRFGLDAIERLTRGGAP